MNRGQLNLVASAEALVASMDSMIQDAGLVEALVIQYKEIGKSDEAKRLGFAQAALSDQTRLRLHFELLCFAAFLACNLVRRYLRRRFFRRPALDDLSQFHGAVGYHLDAFCKTHGLTSLKELVVTRVEPSIEFGEGKPLDPVTRLDQFMAASRRVRGGELEVFSKHLAKSFDPPNYPILEIAMAPYAKVLISYTIVLLDSLYAGRL